MTRQELRAKLAEVEAAEFPRDYQQLAPHVGNLKRDTREGRKVQERWRIYVAQGKSIPDLKKPYPLDCPPSIFLPLLQAELAAATARHWTDLTAGLVSRKWAEALRQPVPAKAAALEAQAAAEDAKAITELKSRLGGFPSWSFGDLLKFARPPRRPDPKARQRWARRMQDMKPLVPQIRAWSAPMTQHDYVDATGVARKTIQRFLARIKASPCSPRRHAYAPGSYSVAVNLKVLANWIEHWVRDTRHACGLAGATLAWADYHDRAFLPQLLRTLCPVFKRRKLSRTDLLDAIDAHMTRYAPPPPDPFMAALGYSP